MQQLERSGPIHQQAQSNIYTLCERDNLNSLVTVKVIELMILNIPVKKSSDLDHFTE